MKTPEQRIAELERTVMQLQRDLAGKPSREAMPLTPRKGWFLGITRENFTKGTDEFYQLDIWTWSATLSQWRKFPGPVFLARDWFLNDGETVDKETKVKVEWYETTWVVTALYCSAVDEDGEFSQSLSVGALASSEGGGSFSDSYAQAFSSPGESFSSSGLFPWQE